MQRLLKYRLTDDSIQWLFKSILFWNEEAWYANVTLNTIVMTETTCDANDSAWHCKSFYSLFCLYKYFWWSHCLRSAVLMTKSLLGCNDISWWKRLLYEEAGKLIQYLPSLPQKQPVVLLEILMCMRYSAIMIPQHCMETSIKLW